MRILIYIIFSSFFLNSFKAQTLPCFTTNSFNLIAGSDTKYNIFLSGEYHYKKGNQAIELTLFKELYFHKNVRVYIFELGYSWGLLLDDYLKHGNKACFNGFYYKQDFELFKGIKQFYDSLPANDKFQVVGVDYEKDPMAFFSAIKILTPPERNNFHFKSLDKVDSVFNYYAKSEGIWLDLKPFIKLFEEDFIQNDSLMSQFYGKENYTILKNVIAGHKVARKYVPKSGNDVKNYSLREEYIYNNVINVARTYPEKNIYGQFGFAHIPIKEQRNWEKLNGNWESFAAKLNTRDESPFKNKVCSIGIYYPKIILFKKTLRFSIEKKNISKLNKIAKNAKITAFDLMCIDPIYYTDFVKTKFQYLIINKY